MYLEHWQVFNEMAQSLFAMAKLSVEIAIGLLGVLALWMGIMNIAEKAGLLDSLAKRLTPVFQTLMPDVPAGHPALASVTMNLTANALGMDNAATPMGLKAMQDLQSLNPNKETATDAQILFLVLNTSSVTLLPITVFVYRAQQGAANPTDVFIPILLATLASTLVGLLCVAYAQKINLLRRQTLPLFAGLFALLLAFIGYLSTLTASGLEQFSTLSSGLVICGLLLGFALYGTKQGTNVYDDFIEGAKGGVKVVVTLIPYLLAMLVAIGWLRASGALEVLLDGVRTLCVWLGWDARFVEALPTALMKPLSGSGARAMMVETMNTYGADSFAGRLASMIQGSTETTFYVLAVYFGSVGIRNGRHAIVCGLAADAAGITAAIAAAYYFFG
nr:nucleoside recognition domain-containing protein [Ferrimonas aestuarii]